MRLRTLGILVVLLFAPAAATENLTQDFTGFGLVCVNDVCPGTPCADLTPQTQAAESGCMVAAECKWWQQWAVEGEFSGTGNITVRARCGEEFSVECTASVGSGFDCASGIEGPGEGHLICELIQNGTIDHAAGACEDPVNPDIIYLAVPPGTPYDIQKYAMTRAEYDALRAAI